MLTKKPTAKLAGGVVHDLPADICKMLEASPKLTELWQSFTPLARNEWICWTITCKQPETRAKHLVVMRDKMLKGMRRPCCWVGCMHRERTGTA